MHVLQANISMAKIRSYLKFILGMFIFKIHLYLMHAFFNRVKKPDEFNRPRIPYSQRKVKTRSSKFLSKKVQF